MGANRKRERGYFPRVRALWNLLLIADPRGMADVHPRQVARVVGCSERTVRRHWWKLVRGGKNGCA